jgi:glycine betaine catabolism B
MSMTRTTHQRGDEADVVFVHSARTPDDIVFRAELEEMAATNPRIRVVAVCEEDSATQRWTGRRGRLTLPMLRSIAPDLTDREVFTCGPPAYMDSVRAMLDEVGAAPERRHEESFILAGSADSPAGDRTGATVVRALPTEAGFSVELRRSGCTITCEPGSTVLDAAERAGLSLPSSCGEGVCGTCKTTMLSGSVDMDHGGGIRPREIAENKVLLCCSSPRADLVLDA